MTLATMADRSLPLAERVLRLVNEGGTLSGAEYATTLDELLADIAAADRLARATDWETDPSETCHESAVELMESLAAYRARMAQGVGDA